MPLPRQDTVRHAKLGRYAIVGKIATGGMATVYLSRLHGDGGFNREFALKVIHPHLAEEEGFTERFTREAHLASRVRHHNIVSTVDAGHALGYAYLVLELVDGVTLRQLIVHRDQPFGFVEAAQIVADAARGLHALHTATDEDGTPLGIVHRDLSPHNIMLDRHGRTVLIDLGLAKAQHSEAQTQVGVMMGKLPYMSPEQSRLEPVDARSDVFALGTVLFELCLNEMPFGDTHTTRTLERLNACETEPVARQLNERGAPRWLVEVILTCLRADPEERYPTAEAVSDALMRALLDAGHDAAVNRHRLAEVVTTALPKIGKVIPVAGIVARLPEGGARPPRGWLRWTVAAAAAAGIATAAFATWGGLTATTAAPSARPDAAGLASDAAAGPTSTPAPAKMPPASVPTARGESPAPSAADSTGGSTEDDAMTGGSGGAGGSGGSDGSDGTDTGASATKRRNKRRRRPTDPDAPTLKPNPYAKP
jgi:serine/threonine-protein kinase